MALGCLALASCGADGPTTPSAADQLSRTQVTAHIEFQFSEGDAVDAARQEAYYDWVIPYIGVSPPQRLQYRKYRDRGHLQRVTGQSTNGFADPPGWVVHTIWPWDAHEAVHVYTALIGRPPDFFNEGIAVALSFDPLEGRFVSLWNNTPIDTIARQHLSAGTLPAISGLAETEAFRLVADQLSYPVAGSFVGFLVRERGMASMRAFFQGGSRGEALSSIQSRFAAAFGWSLAEAETRWRVFLASP
jgi:hypothetical protein